MQPDKLEQSPPTNPAGIRSLPLLLVALLCAGLVFGCAQVRKTTYPGDYLYMDQPQVQSKMAQLSLYMRQMDEVLLDYTATSSDQQQRVLGLLNNIDKVTADLGGDITTNHPVIDEHIDQFKIAVNTAIHNARADPPNYYALGRLSGSCVGCHQNRE